MQTERFAGRIPYPQLTHGVVRVNDGSLLRVFQNTACIQIALYRENVGSLSSKCKALKSLLLQVTVSNARGHTLAQTPVSAVGCDRQLPRIRVVLPAHFPEPGANGRHGRTQP